MTALIAPPISLAASGFFPGAGEFVLLTVLYLVIGFLPVCGISYLIYFLLTLPMRRNERARLFVDLLELGLKDGRTPETAVMDAAASRDRSPGARFHLLAAYLEKGERLDAALDRVPRLLPPEVAAMLKSGERIGQMEKVLPACRRLLGDGVSQTRGALNYLLLLAFAVTPFAIFVPIAITTFVLPKYREVFAGMSGATMLPPFTEWVFAHSGLILSVQIGILVFIWLSALFYIGGPRLHGWIGRILPGVPDWLMFQLPWRRRRMQRDFTAMLALLLDAEISEAEAVRLAAGSGANLQLRRRAQSVASRLEAGAPLPEAIRTMDASGELSWRLTNALRRRSGFLRALAGWHDSLDAKAFQMEQAAAQLATAALVLLNGLVVAGVVIGVFLALINLLNRAVLW